MISSSSLFMKSSSFQAIDWHCQSDFSAPFCPEFRCCKRVSFKSLSFSFSFQTALHFRGRKRQRESLRLPLTRHPSRRLFFVTFQQIESNDKSSLEAERGKASWKKKRNRKKGRLEKSLRRVHREGGWREIWARFSSPDVSCACRINLMGRKQAANEMSRAFR